MTRQHGSPDKRLTGRARQELRSAFLRAHPLCAECERKGIVRAADELDHITPLSRGGTHEATNLQGLCGPCHTAKTRQERGLDVKGCDANGVPLAGWKC